ncbi:MAG: hypothetical protein AAF745_07590 [Planctomycetota bacterium]
MSESTNDAARSVSPEVKRRVLRELRLVRNRFGESMRLSIDEVAGASMIRASISLTGTIRLEGQRVPVRVRYPGLYPLHPPEVWVGMVASNRCPHVLAVHDRWSKICWIDGGSDPLRHRRWDPNRHTAVTALLAAQRWLAAWMVWRRLGHWPVADAWERRA